MKFNILLGFITSILMFYLGIMLRFSKIEGWRRHRKYWLFFILLGLLSLVIKVYSLLLK